MSNYCKYNNVKHQVSYDNGNTWIDLGGVTKGSLSEYGSLDCGYSPASFEGKYLLSFKDGAIKSGACTSDTVLTHTEVWSFLPDHGLVKEDAIGLIIGDCVRTIGHGLLGGTENTGIKNIYIPSGVTSIENYAFGSSNLISLNIPDTVTNLGPSLCMVSTELTNITIGSGITEIPSATCWHCSALTTANISSGVTKIGTVAFSYCSSLTSLPNLSSVREIGGQAFENCSGLTGNIVIPNSVTTIGRSAFYGCDNITSITIGTGITSIGASALAPTSRNIQSVTILATTPPDADESSFPSVIPLCPIYVPRNSLNAYKAKYNWPWFVESDRLKPIPN